MHTSKIVLGTMRFSRERLAVNRWASLISDAVELGVTRLHCSSEYESYPLLLEVLEQLRASQLATHLSFVVKLAEPSFNLRQFSPQRFYEHIDKYRNVLGVDRLETVQWMWRDDLQDHAGRASRFVEQAGEIQRTVQAAKSSGAIGSFVCFPYSPGFASRALEFDFIDGLAIYRSPIEPEYDSLIETCERLGKQILVIRPFAAGSALANDDAASLIRYSSEMTSVNGIVVSCSSINHLRECVQAAS